MDKILSVTNIKRCKTSYGQYIIEVELEREVKRFKRDKDNNAQMKIFTYKAIKKEYFWRKKLANIFLLRTRAKIDK